MPGFNQTQKNRKMWDGLHEFSPKCYTCALIETDFCCGCRGNDSGEFDFYTGPDETTAPKEEEAPVLCDGCCHLEDLCPVQCLYCINNSNYEEED